MNRDNVSLFTGITTEKFDARDILDATCRLDIDEIVIVGMDKKGNEIFISNISDSANALYHLERAKHKLMGTVDQLSGQENV